MAEYVITAALLLLRRAWFASARVATGEWPRTELMGRELAGKRLGLVGYPGRPRAALPAGVLVEKATIEDIMVFMEGGASHA